MDFPNIGVSEPFHEAGRSMGHQTNLLRLGHAMDLPWFLICFLLLDCGWWGMKGCSLWLGMVDFGSFRRPAAIISLGSRWLHVVDFTTFVGAVHQLKARSRKCLKNLGLENGVGVGNSSNGYPSKIGHVQRKDQQKPVYLDLSLRHHSSTWQGLPSTWWDCATCLSCRTGGGTCGCCSL